MEGYHPSDSLLEGIRNLFPMELCPWDDYYARMAQTDFFAGRHKVFASKTYFIRQAPFGGVFAILGGLTEFLRSVSSYRFTSEVAKALLDMGYRKEFTNYLKAKEELTLRIFSVDEGAVFLPNEPAIVLEGDLLSLRFAEGLLLKSLNFPSLSMTKWHRVVAAAHPGKVMEFGRRRAQNDLRTSLYAYLAGCDFSSNAEIRRGFNIPVTGTMGHEFIQGWGDEFKAFDNWLEHNPDRPVLLIDTLNTIKSGLPNAIKAFKKHLDRIKNAGGHAKMAVRNDSGDLAYLTIEERKRLDEAGLENVFIIQTNELDEYAIRDIRQQVFSECNSGDIDPNTVLSKIIWACGTNPGTCSDQPSIGGVAKLTSIVDESGREKAVMKISDNLLKTSIPGSNRSVFVWNEDELACCLIHGKNENPKDSKLAIHPNDKHMCLCLNKHMIFEPRQHIVYNSFDPKDDSFVPSSRDFSSISLEDVRTKVKEEIRRLHWSHRRLRKPHTIKVSLTEKLFDFRRSMINDKKLIEQ
jgi:nicotinate phosphoribosyltransferase